LIYKHVRRGTEYRIISDDVTCGSAELVDYDTVDIYRLYNGKLWTVPRNSTVKGELLYPAVVQGKPTICERMVVYKCLRNGNTWVRSYKEFHDGRFKVVTR
jgi:hypothetical protein